LIDTHKKDINVSGNVSSPTGLFDVTEAIDRRFSPLQKMMYVLAALAMILDGFDGQLIGFAIPSIMKEWGVTREAFSTAVASGLFGMAIGSVAAGYIADRIGRRLLLVASVFLFGGATVLIGFAPDVGAITAIRFFAGLGIGAALPSASTMTAEYTPKRLRTLAVSATIICYPLGGMLAGLFAGQMLPAAGWRPLFFVGGAIPMVYAVVLFFTLGESPRYLARVQARWEELRAILARMAIEVPAGLGFHDGQQEESGEQRATFSTLFSAAYLRDTAGMWICFFMTLLSIYSAFSWLPTMLTAEGLSPKLAGMGLTAYNLGGVIGAIACAIAINRYGSRASMMVFCLMAVVTAFALKGVDVRTDTDTFLLGLGVHGLFMNAVQTTSYALCAHLYPTWMRATGTASALSFGRLGAILSSFVGASVITAGGATAYLNLLGGSMIISLVGLALIKNHIPRNEKVAA
jgi:AAHS family 4-hydroxybenzoate transporter-like MFS transporter